MITCKCCGNEARWCGEGEYGCDLGDDCMDIHCNHCGMHYSLMNEEVQAAETPEDAKVVMYKFYTGRTERAH